MTYSISADIFKRFPGYVRGVVTARGVRNHPSPEGLVQMLREAEESVRGRLKIEQLAETPRIKSWREANHTLTRLETRAIEFNVDGLPPVTPEEVERACSEMNELVSRFCGGETRSTIERKSSSLPRSCKVKNPHLFNRSESGGLQALRLTGESRAGATDRLLR